MAKLERQALLNHSLVSIANMCDTDTRDAEAAALKRLFDEAGVQKKAFARDHHLPGGASMLSQHLSGHRPISLDAARVYAVGLRVPVSAFSPRLARDIAHLSEAMRGAAGGVVEESSPPYGGAPSDLVRVPLLANAASMGPGADDLHEDITIGQLALSAEWLRRAVRPTSAGALRFIHAYGDSMHPTFGDGDVLLVDTQQRDPGTIDGVYVLRGHGRLYVKRVRRSPVSGQLEISSDNATVKTVDVLNGDTQLDVAGRVIWAWNGRRL